MFMKVKTLNETRLRSAAQQLWRQVLDSGYAPTLVVGIERGGGYVTDAMGLTELGVAVERVRVQHATTQVKNNRGVSSLMRRLPYVVSNVLRSVEMAARHRQTVSFDGVRDGLSPTLAAKLQQLPANEQTKLLVVDDAVDSGITLAKVMSALGHVEKAGGEVRSAALVVTSREPAWRPDYCLEERVLYRFPWSNDYHG